MERRSFLQKAGAGLAAGIVASPAVSQQSTPALPDIKWRMASSFPKSIDTLFGAGQLVSKRVGELTSGKFQIQVFAAGELVPGLQVLDAVQSGTVEMGHTASSYYVGKDPTFALGTAIPFGLNARQFDAWWIHGGGEALMNEFYKDYSVLCLPLGNTGAQMGGWYRREIKSVADLKGLKMRIAGLAGEVMIKVGVTPQQIAGGDVYPSLEKGTIDATEFIGPYDDEKLGFYKIAKFYYYPAWWEGNATLNAFVNLKQWESLPGEYKAALQTACSEAHTWMVAREDALNPAALRRLVAAGTQLRPFPRAVLQACHQAARELYQEISNKNAKFKKVYDAMDRFQRDEILWFRVAENGYDNYMASAEANSAMTTKAIGAVENR